MVLILVVTILPESPKFLIAQGKYAEASKVLSKIAKFNGQCGQITEKDISIALELGIECEEMIEKNEVKIKSATTTTCVSYYLTHPLTNLLKTFGLAYLFIAMSMIYFGVSLGITSISENFNPYMMYLLSSLAEFIGYSIGMLDKKISRKNIMIISLGLAGIMCLTVAVIPVSTSGGVTWNSILIIANASIGKMAASAAFNLIYLYASQFYPTGVRNTLVSYVTCAGRIGSIISPQINLLRLLVWGPLPYFIFSANAFLSCVIVFFMPDPA